MAESMHSHGMVCSLLHVSSGEGLNEGPAIPQLLQASPSAPAPGLAAVDARIWQMMLAGAGGGLGISGRGGPSIMPGDGNMGSPIFLCAVHAMALRQWRRPRHSHAMSLRASS